MTIICSNKNENDLIGFLKLAGVVFILVVAFGIYSYNYGVSIKHEINEKIVKLNEVEVENAELKTKFSLMTSAKKINEFVKDSQLVLEKNPKYIKSARLVMN